MAAQFVDTEIRGDVAWIYLNSFTKAMEAADRETIDVHEAIGWALHNARYDAGIKLIVITGREDGEFYSVPPATNYAVPGTLDRINPLKRPGGFAGPSHYPDAIETLAQIEKPVIAKVNGDVIGFGQSVLWGCDIIVAREDAVISDVHLGQGDVIDHTGEARGFPMAITPGDGAMAFFPLFLPPTKLKEYMFLSRAWTAKELADMNVVNYAVPAAELDAVFDDIMARLSARPASVLAHTKRVCNKHVIHQANLARDLSGAYEILDLWQHGRDDTM
jgi:enoyl-CoA hydratase